MTYTHTHVPTDITMEHQDTVMEEEPQETPMEEEEPEEGLAEKKQRQPVQTVHRCRFVEYQPNCINSFAVQTHPTATTDEVDEKIAVARSNGDIEIWNISSGWHMERVIPGGEDISVEQVIWHGNRLFTAGLHSMITEWNVSKLRVETIVDSFGGSVWCIAMNKEGTKIAAGCEDGSIKILDMTDDTLVFVKSFDRQEGRILSVDWHADGETIVSGASDSTIRLWNVETGKCKLRITVQTAKKQQALVWSVKILENMTIVSGDSLGKTQIWDGKFGTLLQSFVEHEADVLVTAVSSDSKHIFSSGVDNRLIQLTKLDDTPIKQGEWVLSARHRDHTHDVRALALSPRGAVVTGGLDTNLMVYQAARFSRYGASHRKIPPFPQNQIFSIAPKANMVCYQRDRAVKIWQLGVASENADEIENAAKANQARNGGNQIRVEQSPRMLVELKCQSTGNIVSSGISADGAHVAYSNMMGTRIFNIHLEEETGSYKMSRVRKIKEDLLIAHAMLFTPDTSMLLSATTDEHLQVINVKQAAVMATIKIPCDESDQRGSCLMAVSDDGQWVVVAYSLRFHIFNLDTLQHHGTTPSFGALPSAVSFFPSTSTIVIACVNNRVYMYDVDKQEQTDWSKEHSHQLPLQWVKKREKTVSISFDPTNKSKAYFHDHAGVYIVDFSKNIPKRHAQLAQIGGNPVRNKLSRKRDRKRRQEEHAAMKLKRYQTHKRSKYAAPKEKPPPPTCQNFKLVKKFQPLLFFGVAGVNTLVVVERPWVAVMKNFPAPLMRKKYGV
eukprot:m.170849 g.170849  ORF g.170849 m.170849 type:complete len:782 (-) comp31622_c1_seq1:25-2370(-)